MEELNSKNKTFIRVPNDKAYTGSYVMEEREQLCLQKQWIINKLIEGTPELSDYNGSPDNLGDIFRHLELNGVDISALRPLIQKKGNFTLGLTAMIYIPSSQNGNIQ